MFVTAKSPNKIKRQIKYSITKTKETNSQCFSVFFLNAKERERKSSLLTCWSSLRAWRSALADSSSLLLVSLTCWHLLGASLSHWSDSSHSACEEAQKGWCPLLGLGGSWLLGDRLGCSGGYVKMAPPTPNLHPLHLFFGVMS